jgi:hypothetical protein
MAGGAKAQVARQDFQEDERIPFFVLSLKAAAQNVLVHKFVCRGTVEEKINADRVERRPFEGIAGRIRRSQPDGTRQRRPAAGLPRSPHGDEGLTYMGFGDPPPYQTSRFRSQGGGQDASRQWQRHRRRRPSAPRRRGKGSFRARPSRKAFARHANKRRPDANPGVLAGRAAGS